MADTQFADPGPEQDAMTRTLVMEVGPPAGPAPSAQVREHFLVLVEGVQPGLRVRVGEQPLKVGRGTACDLVLADKQVSGLHCEVTGLPHLDDLLVSDQQSTNGTYVDGRRLREPGRVPQGGQLRLGVQLFRHEVVLQAVAATAEGPAGDMESARSRVEALLPEPITEGRVLAEWVYEPSGQLGGDAFGYQAIDEHRFSMYLLDASGDGAAAGQHAANVMEVMRRRALPDTDLGDPRQVLRSLNEAFQMDRHGGRYFSMWYGVYDARSRMLRYASAGHHPAYLVRADRSAMEPLQTRNLVVGALRRATFSEDEAAVAPGSSLYLFSDGVYEAATAQGTSWGLPSFVRQLQQAGAPRGSEAKRLHGTLRQVARPGPLDDDFSLVVLTFP